MALKVLYHEDALAELEFVLDWSRQHHLETTERFAEELFEHIELLGEFPRLGTSVKGRVGVRRVKTTPGRRWLQ